MRLSEAKALERLRRFVADAGSQKRAAGLLSISEQYLSDVLNHRRAISDVVASGLGLVRRVYFIGAKDSR